MKNRIDDIRKYAFSSSDRLLLDTNIWLLLLPAPSASRAPHATTYSSAITDMIRARSTVLLNGLVLSEYLNRYCRIEWNAQRPKPTFKDFRRSAAFRSVGRTAMAKVRRILKLCTQVGDGFSSVDVERSLESFETGATDVNDALFLDMCRRNGWTLVTDDGDFRHGGIRVITGNRRLLCGGS